MRKLLFCCFKKNERGIALVEFALVAPILLALVLGIIEFGWIYNGYVSLNGAVREGARIASIKGVLPEDNGDVGYIKEEVNRHITNTLENIETEVEKTKEHPANNPKEWGVKVSATGTITPLLGIFVSEDEFELYAEAIMRIK